MPSSSRIPAHRKTVNDAFHPARLISTAILLCLGQQALDAQTAYSAAHGNTAIRPWQYGFFAADFTEAKFGLTFMRPLALGCTVPDCRSNQISFSAHAAAAGRKGQQDLLSKVDFVPGFDVGGSVAFVTPTGDRGGYELFFLRGAYSTQERKFAISNPNDSTTTIGQLNQRTFAATLGFNHAFSNLAVLGVAIEGRRELSSPGVQRAFEVCGPGTAQGGFMVIVCTDRYPGPLPDLWTGQARVDASFPLAALGADPNSLHFGLLTAASVDLTEHADAEANFALGGSLLLPDYPGEPVLSLIIGVDNVFDSNPIGIQTNDSYFDSHFLARLAFSIPFRVMAGTQ